MTITAAKARLSELVNRLIHKDDTIIISKKGKNVAVLLPITTYRDLSPENKPDLLSARGALAELDDEMDEFITTIYREREREKDRTT
jgi:prevent-host-death family protein